MGLALELIKKYDKFEKDQREYNQELIDDMNRMIRSTAKMPKVLKIVEYKR